MYLPEQPTKVLFPLLDEKRELMRAKRLLLSVVLSYAEEIYRLVFSPQLQGIVVEHIFI